MHQADSARGARYNSQYRTFFKPPFWHLESGGGIKICGPLN